MTISARLVGLVEKNADQLTKRWMELVRTHPGTPTYHTYDEAKLYQRAFSVYSQFGKWLSADTTADEIQEIYIALGAQRRKEGFALSELLQALIITRRVLWLKVEADGPVLGRDLPSRAVGHAARARVSISFRRHSTT
jgi:hypothetical protein